MLMNVELMRTEPRGEGSPPAGREPLPSRSPRQRQGERRLKPRTRGRDALAMLGGGTFARLLLRGVALVILCAATTARADDAIEGVQPAALDQPRVYISFRRGSANASPLAARAGAGSAKAEQDKMLKQLGIAPDAADDGPQIGAEAFL